MLQLVRQDHKNGIEPGKLIGKVLGANQRIQITLQGKGVLGMVVEDLEAIEANEGRRDLQEKMGSLAPWDQLVLGDSLGGMGYPPLLAPLPPQV